MKSDLFIAKKWPSWEEFKENEYNSATSYMGYASSRRSCSDSDYYLTTDGKILYSLGAEGAKVKSLLGLTPDLTGKWKSNQDAQDVTIELKQAGENASLNIATAAGAIRGMPGYNRTKKLMLFMHGFNDNADGDNSRAVVSAFLAHGGYNVLAVDGRKQVASEYLQSTRNAMFVGQKIGRFLVDMHRDGLQPADIHLIGHSLGAHIVGFAGKTFQSSTGRRVGRISGLDPAGPCYSHVDEGLRLEAGDADYVDVIHTNAGVFGLNDDVGHADFYVNGGVDHPGCTTPVCSHRVATALYGATVRNPLAFKAKTCSNYQAFKWKQCGQSTVALMGYGSNPETRGRFFLRTSAEEPFGLGNDGLE